MDPENPERGGQDTCLIVSYTDTIYFSENSINIAQNFKEKWMSAAPSPPPPLHPEIRPCIICMIPNKLKLPADKLCGYSGEDLKQKLAIVGQLSFLKDGQWSW